MKHSAPTYLQSYITSNYGNIIKPSKNEIEWCGQVISSTGSKKFLIKFYGEQFTKNFRGKVVSKHGLIGNTDFSEPIIIAEDIITKERILLFDGCKHGFNAMFCDEFTEEQIINRPKQQIYKDSNGNSTFEVIIKTHYNINFQDNFKEYFDDQGFIKLINGSKISKGTLFRNGFDYLAIDVINSKGEQFRIAEFELA